MDLVEFLTARLDEDEAAAQRCSPWPWSPNDEHEIVVAEDGIEVAEQHALSGPQVRADTDHIARHDPARVLREVDAKRRIVADHEHGESSDWNAYQGGRWGFPNPPKQYGCFRCDDWDGWVNGSDGCETVRALAAVYADHPDYREEWKPY